MAGNLATFSGLNSAQRGTITQELKILQWNANGIYGRQAEFKQYLSKLTVLPHILCIQETRLKPGKRISIHGYNIERKDRQDRAGGGVLIAILDTLPYTVLDTGNYQDVIAIRVKLKDGYCCIYNIYSPPGDKIDLNIPISSLANTRSILLGDINAYSPLWGADHLDTKGKTIEKFIDENNLVVLNTGQGTHLKNNGGTSPIDVTLATRNLSLKSAWLVNSDNCGSDHYIIDILINEPPVIENNTVTKFITKRADWEGFQKVAGDVITDGLLTEDIEQSYQNIKDAIITAAKIAIPIHTNKRKRKTVPYWNNSCEGAIKKRKRAEKKMKKKRSLGDCINYRKEKAQTQRIIKNSQQAYWESYCDALTDTTKLGSVWKMARKMTGNTANSQIRNLNYQNRLYETSVEKADLLASTFSQVASTQKYSATFKQRKLKMESVWGRQPPSPTDVHPELNDPFEFHELKSAIRQSKQGSAPGHDAITYEMLKHLPKSSLNTILTLYNILWNNGTLIKEWKDSIVIPILKQGLDPTDPDSYRPIALTSAMCKIMERIITNRLTWFVEKNNILNPAQTGFRKNRGTLDQLIRLHDNANKSINNRGYTLAVFLDMSKAYDLLWKHGLLHKLRKLNVSGPMYSWIADFLSNRTIQVRVGSTLSKKYLLENGTPQGSVISPLLFILMNNDFPTINDLTTQTSLFADDSAIWKSGRNLKTLYTAIQNQLNKISAWCMKWGFIINTKKTVAMIFTRRRIKENTVLMLNKKPITKVTQAKFLGLIFDPKLTWNNHINYLVAKCQSRINLLRSLSGQTWGASKKALLSVYRTLIRSKLDYGSELFHTASQYLLKKLDVIQSKCLRICCGAMHQTPIIALEQECGEMPLKLRRTKILFRHCIRIKTLKDNPASACLDDCWQNYYGNNRDNKQTVYQQTEPIRGLLQDPIHAPVLTAGPGWRLTTPSIDCTLSQCINKKIENPLVAGQTALQYLHEKNLESFTKIYTDGSKTADNHVGCGVYVPQNDIKISYRLPDHCSVYIAELVGIKCALNFVKTNNSENGILKYCILTDSLSSLHTLQRGPMHPHIPLVQDIFQLNDDLIKQNIIINFSWIPSHVAILGNEQADALAKEGTKKPNIDIDIGRTVSECYSFTDSYIQSQWQLYYDQATTGKHYKEIEPVIENSIKYTDRNRKKEKIMTRIRLGHCFLNYYLHRINLHPSGLCQYCQTPETLQHFIFNCKHYNITEHLKIDNFKTLFSNKDTINTIYRNIISSGRDV
jgi:ribonuclease HI